MRRSISVVMEGPAEVAHHDPREPEQLGVKPCWRSNGMNTGDRSTKNRDNSWYRERSIYRLPRRLSSDDLTPTPPDVRAWLKGLAPTHGFCDRAVGGQIGGLWEAWDDRYPELGLGTPRPLPRRLAPTPPEEPPRNIFGTFIEGVRRAFSGPAQKSTIPREKLDALRVPRPSLLFGRQFSLQGDE